MLLVIDVGNTQITLGVYKWDQNRPSVEMASCWRIATNQRATADECGARLRDFFHYASLDADQVKGAALASVVPPLDVIWREALQKYFKVTPLIVTADTSLGVKVNVDYPGEVGTDRIVNAVAAFERVKGACIVVDFGTATTFDCVGRRGDYIGGAIAPGPQMAAEALARNTAQLPLLGSFQKPLSPIGRNTLDCLRSGLFYGYVGLTKEILAHLSREMRGRPPILATGGLAPLIAPSVKAIKRVCPELTLEGLRLIWQRHH